MIARAAAADLRKLGQPPRKNEGNATATRALTGLSLGQLVAVCDELRVGKRLADLVIDLRSADLVEEWLRTASR